MARRLRYQHTEWATHHVVSRCFQGYHLLKPTQQNVAIIKGVLGRSLALHTGEIELHHYAFLSNHFHLLLSSREASSLASFMCHFKSNLARALSRANGWSSYFWQRRYSSEEVLDEESLRDAFKYVTKNCVKEGLVNHPQEWVGLHGYHQLVQQRPLFGEWIDRCALARGQGMEEASVRYQISLTPPPPWRSLSKEGYLELCRELCTEAISEAHIERRERGFTRALGVRHVLAQDIFERKEPPKHEHKLCWVRCAQRLKDFLKAYRAFREAFLRASAQLREAIDSGSESVRVCFPEGGVPLFRGRVRGLTLERASPS
jgi:putative transposase